MIRLLFISTLMAGLIAGCGSGGSHGFFGDGGNPFGTDDLSAGGGPGTNDVCGGAADCTDGMKNGMETDVDCGGALCGKCDNDLLWLRGADCESGVCTGNRCMAAPSCTDNLKNQDETDIDCGGN